jgi:hypothetical protein
MIQEGINHQSSKALFFKNNFLLGKNFLPWSDELWSRIVISTPKIAFYMYGNFHSASHILKMFLSSLHFYRITVFLVPHLPFRFPPHTLHAAASSPKQSVTTRLLEALRRIGIT